MNKRIERIKEHLAENKWVYISCAATGVVCAGVTALMMPKNVGFNIAFAWKQDVTQSIAQSSLKPRMRPGIRLQHNETMIEYPSIRYAAKVLGLERNQIYRHLQGKLPDVDGNTFTNLGVMVWDSRELHTL
jgi:hypothetical protein